MAHSFDRWVGKVAIVTGASAGIGAGIVERLVKEGVVVAALARRKERLEQLATKLSKEKGKIYPIKADVTKEEDILKAFKWIKQNLGPIHILINNAGISQFGGNLYDGKTEDWERVFKVNVIGLCIATREAIKDMRENNVAGHIIHINSVAGHEVIRFPGMNVYTASKYGVTALAETLRHEMADQKLKIKVTSFSPGMVDTEMIPEKIKSLPMYTDAIKNETILYPPDIAESVVYVLSTPPHVQVRELTITPID